MKYVDRIHAYFNPKSIKNVPTYLKSVAPEKSDCLKYFRVAAVCIFFGIYFHSIFAMAGTEVFYIIAFTQWGLGITALTFILLMLSSFISHETNCGLGLHKTAYLFFEMAWTAEVVITTVFWTILTIVDFEQAGQYDLEVIIFMGETHLMPISLLIIEFRHNKVRFTKSHAVFVAIPPLLFTIVSIFFSYAFNIIAYPILTWKDYKTIIFGVLIAVLFAGGFLLGYWVGERKHRSFIRLQNRLQMETPTKNDILINEGSEYSPEH